MFSARVRSGLRIGLALTFATAWLGACSDETETTTVARIAPPSPLPPQDAAWSRYLHSHTAGVISAGSKVRVQFVSNVIPEERIGSDDATRLVFEPALEGTASWKDLRELVFVPRTTLPAGQTFRVKLAAKGLEGVPQELPEYMFDFTVRTQDFDVRIDGLVSQDAKKALVGSLATADLAESEQVEKLLSATRNGAAQPIRWTHSADGLSHSFTVAGIESEKNADQVLLRWDGSPLGLKTQGESVIDVPALGEFKLLSVSAATSGDQAARIEFSLPLDPRQDLTGLVQLGSGNPKLKVVGSTLWVYPTSPLIGDNDLQLLAGVRSSDGTRIDAASKHTVKFAVPKPGVYFVGNGVILPSATDLKIPFAAANVKSVQVTAFEVYEQNLGQFLQVNGLDGESELRRVGRTLWRRTLQLDDAKPNQWNRYVLDAAPLFKKHPNSMLRLTLSVQREDSTFRCTTTNGGPLREPEPKVLGLDENAYAEDESSGWDYIEEYYEGFDYYELWQHRDDPCWDVYYSENYGRGNGTRAARNFLASNLGIMAKSGVQNVVDVVTTDLRTSDPLAGVQLEVFNFQNRSLAKGTTDAQGLARLEPGAQPFYLIARKGEERGVLKLSPGTALATSHFDVGGEVVEKGVKGTLYGERGVWRPGDDMYLTLALDAKADALPEGHPATLRLFNPRGQLVETLTNTTPVGRFYAFKTSTVESAPTGPWKAVAQVGGLKFEKSLRVETLVPNRLKVELGFDGDTLRASKALAGKIASRWLHGGSAAGLRTDVTLQLTPRPTRFTRAEGFAFDDPARELQSEKQTVFEGRLDPKGNASFSTAAPEAENAPGMLTANLTTRVFEEGGGYSFEQKDMPFHPYDAYVGLKLPKGDSARNMLLTDRVHTVQIASLTADGAPASMPQVDVSLYQIDWKWWWDTTNESLSRYASGSFAKPLRQERIATTDGQGKFDFEIKAPAWGRYLVRVCDAKGGHCAGKVFYIDWPGWAGKAGEDSGAGANVLSVESDKPAYTVGDKAKIRIPEFDKGRALLTVETGTAVVERRWVEAAEAKKGIEITISRQMVPNAYVAIALIQPHEGKANDRPIRVYGYVPIQVSDPATHLKPVVESAPEWLPRKPVQVKVREASGRPMTYTLAVVDEGLLGLTSFKTPDLHGAFFKREALGVRTWDLFDQVAGAYGGSLERMLALGGDGFARATRPPERARRFPPVVIFKGPYQLEAGKTDTHEITLPQYIGAVRAMVVAGGDGAYGSSEISVPVREPLMLLSTLPRLLRPGEQLDVPVSVFVTDAKVKNVTVELKEDATHFSSPDKPVRLEYSEPGDQLAFLPLTVGEKLGMGKLRFTARGDGRQTEQEVNLEVRAPNPSTIQLTRKELAPGEAWETRVEPYGLAGTQRASFEVSALPSLNLESRLDYLIRYPHGCLEQVTSAAFPQMYLPELAKLTDKDSERVRSFVQAAVKRLRGFQLPDGSFTYWPDSAVANDWANIYAGHFLLEAAAHGYEVPDEMSRDWLAHLEGQARSWVTGGPDSQMLQAYRLYTLALGSRPEIGAMNRLRESGTLTPTTSWLLAGAYVRAGLKDAAQQIAPRGNVQLASLDPIIVERTFGSELRDKALVLEPMTALGRTEQARELAAAISKDLGSERTYSTHTTAWSLMALARYYTPLGAASAFELDYTRGGGKPERIAASKALHRVELVSLDAKGETLRFQNRSQKPLTVQIAVQAVPKAGEEKAASNGLEMKVAYFDAANLQLDVSKLPQAQDLVAEITVKNLGPRERKHLALSYTTPSGWQIQETPTSATPPKQDQPGDDDQPKTPKPETSDFEYRDVRDDSVQTYFALKPGATARYRVSFNASYTGRYYHPAVRVEDMYEPTVQATQEGRWVVVESRTDAPETPAAPVTKTASTRP